MARITKTQLVRLQKKLKTDAAIGREFGITRQAVHQIRQKYGIPSNLIQNPERNDTIYKEYKEGMLVTKIVKKYKLSISQTYRIINNAKEEEAKAKRKKKAKKSEKKTITKKTESKKSKTKVAPKKAVAKKSQKGSKKPVRKVVKATITSEAP